MAIRVVGVVLVGLGLLMMRALDLPTVGLAVWCFGVLVVLDAVLMRDGLPAQLLWALGTGLAVYGVGFTDLPERVAAGPTATVVSAVTAVLGAAMFLRPPRSEPKLPALLHEFSRQAADAARPVRPADASTEVSRTVTIIAGALDTLRAENPAAAAELTYLLAVYHTEHGDDTVASSNRPAALRTAVTELVAEAEALSERWRDGPGYSSLVLIEGYLRRMSALVLGRTG